MPVPNGGTPLMTTGSARSKEMGGNYDEWAGRDSIFRNKLSNLRTNQVQPGVPAAPRGAAQGTNERYLQQLQQEKVERVAAPQTASKMPSIEEMERLALFDEATGLYNFRHFMKQLTYEVKRGERYKRYVAICLVSVDAMHNIRAQYGPDSEQQVMKSATTILQSCIRDVDIAARHPDYGFVVLFPETNAAGLTTVIERIRQKMRSQPMMVAMQQFAISVSVGAAAFPTHARKAEDLVTRAQQSLMVAVERGGDRVCVL
jgi:diguanylate cyclase (GGDEF)-like protein